MRSIPTLRNLLLTLLALAVLSSACSVTATEVLLEPAGAALPTSPPTGQPELNQPQAEAPPEMPAVTQESASDADLGDELTADFLVQAAAKTIDASSLRFEGFFEDQVIGLVFGSRTEPYLVGEVAGDLARTTVDRTNFLSENAVAQAPGGADDFTIRIITEGENAYVNTRMFEVLLGVIGDSATWAEQLATGWGRVDLTVVNHNDLVGSIAIGTGSRGTGILGLLAESREVLDGGEGAVRGVATRVFFTEVPLRAAIEQEGHTTNLPANQEELLDAASIGVEVHVDIDGFVRRIEYATDAAVYGEFADSWKRVDYFDFASETQVTAPSDWVDVTLEMLDFVS